MGFVGGCLVFPITLACVYLLTGPRPLLAFFCLIVLSHDLIKKPTLVSDLPSSCRSLPVWGITGTGTHHIAYPLVLTNFFLASSCGYPSISASWASPQRLSKSQDSILQSSFPFNITSHSKVFSSHTDEREVILPAPRDLVCFRSAPLYKFFSFSPLSLNGTPTPCRPILGLNFTPAS